MLPTARVNIACYPDQSRHSGATATTLPRFNSPLDESAMADDLPLNESLARHSLSGLAVARCEGWLATAARGDSPRSARSI